MSNSITMSVNRNIPVVANFSALPAPATSVGEYYWVETAQGTAWLPGSLGGNYYPEGLYYSNGVIWKWMKSPSQATQVEVDAGTNTDKFLTPETYTNSTLIQRDSTPTASSTNLVTSGGVFTGLGTKQEALVSGTNIKTINGNSLLGSGDLVISGGGGTPAGITGQIQFNDGGVFAADSGLFWDNTNKRLGVGATPASTARLDVRAQGALSTDIAFRVRNSADSANIFEVRGDGNIALFQPGLYESNMKIFGSGNKTIAQFQNETFGSIALGSEATFDALTYGNIALGQKAKTTGGANSIAIGLNARAGNTANISIGANSVCTGQYGIKIGQGQGPSGFGGVNSIHLGRTTSGNNVEPDNVFMTYFNSQSSSTLTRSNGSFGLLGQQAYILGNGTGTYGLDKFMGNGGNTLVVRNHASIPSTNVADSFQQYSADITAGNAAPHFRTENGSVVKLYQETTAIAVSTLISNLGTPLTDTDTFDGYTLKQIVKALRNQGLLT